MADVERRSTAPAPNFFPIPGYKELGQRSREPLALALKRLEAEHPE